MFRYLLTLSSALLLLSGSTLSAKELSLKHPLVTEVPSILSALKALPQRQDERIILRDSTLTATKTLNTSLLAPETPTILTVLKSLPALALPLPQGQDEQIVTGLAPGQFPTINGNLLAAGDAKGLVSSDARIRLTEVLLTSHLRTRPAL